jgi:osmotically inducible protein OsmC
MAIRNATAQWEGKLRDGKGTFAGESGLLSGAFDFGTRFGTTKGTNPEEMVGAAHAACFSMALSAGLEGAGFPPSKIDTAAKVTIDKVGDAFRITNITLTTRAKVAGIDAATFAKVAEATKTGCPISAALASVPITLDAALV